MARTIPLKRYSVYRTKDEMPIVIFATSKECAAAIGIANETFRSYLSRQKNGQKYPKKILIYQDEIDADDLTDEERLYIIKPPTITKSDKRAILNIAECGGTQRAAKVEGRCPSGLYYHIKKVKEITGLDAKIPGDLQKLVAMLKEGETDG